MRLAAAVALLLAAVSVHAVEPQPSAGCAREAIEHGRRLVKKIDVAGTPREVILDVPDSVKPGTPAPLLLDFHGFGHSGAGVWNVSGFKGLAERRRLHHRLPGGPADAPAPARRGAATARAGRWTRSTATATSPSSAPCSTSSSATTASTAARVYATGFSNGAFFSQLLACAMSDRIAAVAPVSGGPLRVDCTPARPVPILIQHGSEDDSIPVDSARDTRDRWRTLNGCTGDATAGRPRLPALDRLPRRRRGRVLRGALRPPLAAARRPSACGTFLSPKHSCPEIASPRRRGDAEAPARQSSAVSGLRGEQWGARSLVSRIPLAYPSARWARRSATSSASRTFGESHGGGVGRRRRRLPAAAAARRSRRSSATSTGAGPVRARSPRRATSPTAPRSSPACSRGRRSARRSPSWCATPTRGPSAYEDFKDTYRPSHADYTYEAKYGIRNWQGGGRASARETIGRVAAGAIARKLLADGRQRRGARLRASRCGRSTPTIDPAAVTLAAVESNIVRCPDARRRRGDDRAHRRGAARRRLARRHRRVRLPPRAARAGRAGVRQARGRPGARHDVAAGVEGLRDRQRLRRRDADRHRAQRPVHRRRAAACARSPTAPAACRAASATARTSSSASPSSRPRPSARRSRPSTAAARRSPSKPRAATTPACCRAPCRWSRRWRCLVLADHYLRQRGSAVNGAQVRGTRGRARIAPTVGSMKHPGFLAIVNDAKTRIREVHGRRRQGDARPRRALRAGRHARGERVGARPPAAARATCRRASSSATSRPPSPTTPRRSCSTAAAASAPRSPPTTCRRWATPTSSRWTAAGASGPRSCTRSRRAEARDDRAAAGFSPPPLARCGGGLSPRSASDA